MGAKNDGHSYTKCLTDFFAHLFSNSLKLDPKFQLAETKTTSINEISVVMSLDVTSVHVSFLII